VTYDISTKSLDKAVNGFELMFGALHSFRQVAVHEPKDSEPTRFWRT
jgi:hypothetical protein